MLSSVKGGGPRRPTADLVLESEARLWLDIRWGWITMDDAIEQGRLVVTGKKRALTHPRRILHLA